MAIQHRRGLKVDFDPNKMLPGEFAYALDTAELFYCYGVGNVKRLATIEDIEILLDTNETAYTALQQLIAELENETVLTGILSDISNLQDNKLDKTGVSSNNTVIFSEASEDEDIVSGETHSTLFGKILKSIKTFRGNISNITTNIGTLASLLTTDRSNLVNAINELHQDHATHLAESIQQNEVHGVKLADYVMERGSNYEKWYSGKFIQWGKYNGSEELTNAFGALYRSPNVRRINFPLAFFDKPDVFLESQTHQLLDVYLNDVSANSFGFRGLYVYSQTNIIEFAWRAIGTWK
jgi:hypothetical protein